jgi:hypothetical protein
MADLDDDAADRWAGRTPRVDSSSEAALRQRGAELLMHSADVRFEEGAHPAYVRILGDMAPDEARILRLMAREGPQPAVDVRTAGPPGVGLLGVGSKIVAMGFSMIGAEAGCRDLERVPAYLNNLNRLGLIWFLREPIDDVLRYPVLEAQPEVMEAMKTAGRARTIRRSIHLTPFGRDFCEVCLPLDTAEFEAQVAPAEPLPGPDTPPEDLSGRAPAVTSPRQRSRSRRPRRAPASARPRCAGSGAVSASARPRRAEARTAGGATASRRATRAARRR